MSWQPGIPFVHSDLGDGRTLSARRELDLWRTVEGLSATGPKGQRWLWHRSLSRPRDLIRSATCALRLVRPGERGVTDLYLVYFSGAYSASQKTVRQTGPSSCAAARYIACLEQWANANLRRKRSDAHFDRLVTV